MRTSTAAWAAALAVMSMHGPFTTAHAAPARRGDHERHERHERPRPVYPKLKRRQGFNDTTDPTNGDSSPSPDSSPSDTIPDVFASILGQPPSSSSSPPPPPFIPLSSSASLPASSSSSDPDPNGSENESGSGSSSSAAASSAESDPLLGSIVGPLSNAITPNPTEPASSSGAIIVGITTVLHSSLLGTDPPQLNPQKTGASVVESTTQSDNGILPTALTENPVGTGNVGSILTQVTGTGVLSSVKSGASPLVQSGVSPLVTAITGASPLPTVAPETPALSSVGSDVSQTTTNTSTPVGVLPAPLSALKSSLDSRLSVIKATATDPSVVSAANSAASSIFTNAASSLSSPTDTLDSITSNSPPIVTVPGGTGDATSTRRPTEFTITREGTSVVISVPTNTGDTSVSPPVVTAPPQSGAVSPSFNESDTITTATETGNSSQVPMSQPSAQPTTTTKNDTIPDGAQTSVPSTTIPPSPPSSITPSPPPDTTTFAPQVSIVATGTDTQTSMTVPTTFSFAPTTPEAPSQGTDGIATAASATVSSPGGFPTGLARLVQPAGGMPEPPENFTLVQVGFKFGLNYPFVVSRPESASQIFTYLPQGIAYGLGISTDKVLMNALLPYDTSESLGYITTLAQTYIPSEFANQLQLNLHAPASPLYYNPSSPVKTLMYMVNPTIPVLPGAALDGSPSSLTYNSAATAQAGEGDGAPIGGDSGSSKKISGTSVGIGAAAVAGAAVYAAAMVYVARRYRQKRKGHQRASSVPTAGEMTQRSTGGGMGGLFMSGANGRTSPRQRSASSSAGRGSRTSNGSSSNGRSVREQGISAPLMSENSLGWN